MNIQEWKTLFESIGFDRFSAQAKANDMAVMLPQRAEFLERVYRRMRDAREDYNTAFAYITKLDQSQSVTNERTHLANEQQTVAGSFAFRPY